jgi:hypothetical protein
LLVHRAVAGRLFLTGAADARLHVLLLRSRGLGRLVLLLLLLGCGGFVAGVHLRERDAASNSLRLRPALPPWLPSIAIENLTLGASSVDLEVRRLPDGTHTLGLNRRNGALEVELVSTRAATC